MEERVVPPIKPRQLPAKLVVDWLFSVELIFGRLLSVELMVGRLLSIELVVSRRVSFAELDRPPFATVNSKAAYMATQPYGRLSSAEPGAAKFRVRIRIRVLGFP